MLIFFFVPLPPSFQPLALPNDSPLLNGLCAPCNCTTRVIISSDGWHLRRICTQRVRSTKAHSDSKARRIRCIASFNIFQAPHTTVPSVGQGVVFLFYFPFSCHSDCELVTNLENKDMLEFLHRQLHTGFVESAECEARAKSAVGDIVNTESWLLLRRSNSSTVWAVQFSNRNDRWGNSVSGRCLQPWQNRRHRRNIMKDYWARQ